MSNKFKAIQKTFTYKQTNHASADKVFPLLCPVREKEWLDGWAYRMIYSQSGLIEKDCVFATPHHGETETIWHVTQHDKKHYLIEFLRVTPNENVVRININLKPLEQSQTQVNISYQYTGLNDNQNNYINNQLPNDFKASMQWWEKAINYYLQTGTMLKK